MTTKEKIIRAMDDYRPFLKEMNNDIAALSTEQIFEEYFDHVISSKEYFRSEDCTYNKKEIIRLKPGLRGKLPTFFLKFLNNLAEENNATHEEE